MKQTCLTAILLLTLLCTTANATEPNALCKHVDDFIFEMDRIAMEVDDSEKRRECYDKAIRELVISSRHFFGIFCPCTKIFNLAYQYSLRVEWYRRPPPGWDPSPSRENLLLFHRMAKDIRPYERALSDLCWVRR